MLRRLVILLLLAAPFCFANDQYSETRDKNWEFTPGGRIELHLSAGDLKILPGNDSQLSIRYKMESDRSDFIPKVTTRFEVSPTSASLQIKAPHDGSVDVELTVPTRSDLYLRVFAGDIVIGAVEGNKDVETRAGDIVVCLPENFDVGAVDASTHAGDVNAPWGKPQGWIGGSLKYDGGGKYRVHAHTIAGDIDFKEKDPTEARNCPCD